MIGRTLASLFGNKTAKARSPASHEINLAARPQANLSTVGITPAPLSLPIWVDTDPQNTEPATYEGLFWEIEPMGEYVYYLAGDYAKNEKGLLRFPTATTSARVERNFEQDVIAVAEQDGLREHQQGILTAADLSDIENLTVQAAAQSLLPSAQDLGDEKWIISLSGPGNDITKGRSRLMVWQHPFTSALFADLHFEQTSPEAAQHPALTTLRVSSNDPSARIGDLHALFAPLEERYRNMPHLSLSGASRM